MKFQFIHINTYLKPIYVKPHIHNTYELVYYISGQGVSHYGKGSALFGDGQYIAYTNNMSEDNAFYFGNNDFILYPPGTVHDEQHNAPAELIAIGFEEYDFPTGVTAQHFKDYDLSALRIFEKIREEYRNRDFMYNRVIEAQLISLLVNIFRSRGVKPQMEQFDPIEYALGYINEYYATEINLEQIALSANYSSSRFRELFKKRTGMSPKTYILEKRIEYAKQLLRTTALPIHEIAFIVGFTDYPQFNKFFNRRTGVNPKDFRKGAANEAKKTDSV